VQPFEKLQRPVKHLLTIHLILPNPTTLDLGQRPNVETPPMFDSQVVVPLSNSSEFFCLLPALV
jgi:hypothetical protein